LIGEIDSSSSDSEATSSEDEDDREPPRYIELEDETVRTYKYGYPMTKNEIDYRDLPIVEEVVECPDNVSLTPVGTVLHTTEELTIIESQDGHMPISEGTVLWSDEREYLGRLFETFGPVQKPFYSVRVKGVEKMVPGMMVYVAVGDPHLTHYVFNENVYRGKGCDASWHNDCEAPEEFQDFSDDEAEAISKAMRKHHIKT
jgi:H/ACA ribonucleoprotein complex non-core subunit NAF1